MNEHYSFCLRIDDYRIIEKTNMNNTVVVSKI